MASTVIRLSCGFQASPSQIYVTILRQSQQTEDPQFFYPLSLCSTFHLILFHI